MDNKNLKILLAITLFSIPLYIVRCKNFSVCLSIDPIPFTLLEVLIILTTVFWFFIIFRENRNPEKYFKKLFDKIPFLLKIAIGGFLLSGLLEALVAPNKIAAAGIYKAYFVEPAVLGLIIFAFLDQTKNIKLIIWSLLSPGIWLSLISIFEKIFNYSPFNAGEFLTRGRVGGLYTSSNAVGLFIVPLILIAVGYLLFLTEGRIIERIRDNLETKLVILVFLILVFGQVVSGSRGGYFGLVLALLFFAAFTIYKKINLEKYKLVFRIFLVGVVFFFLTSFIFLFNLGVVINLNNHFRLLPVLEPRLCLWQGTVNQLEQRPILGDGLHGFQIVNQNYHTCSSEEALYPHNIFLNFWAETGLIGLVSFFTIGAFYFFNLLKSEKLDFLNLGFACVFLAILFHGLVDVPFFNNDISTIFWVILGVSLYLINEKSFFKVKKVLIGSQR